MFQHYIEFVTPNANIKMLGMNAQPVLSYAAGWGVWIQWNGMVEWNGTLVISIGGHLFIKTILL